MQRILFEILVYGILFILVIGISYIAGILKKKKRKIQAVTLSIVAIFIVCLFAGLREDTVGTDVRVYAKPVFEGVSQCSLKDIGIFRSDVDYGFKLLAYFVARTTESLGVFLFFVQLFTFVPVYVVAYKRNGKIPIWLTVFVYLCVFYCATFNVMRQSICAAMLLLAYIYFEEKKYVKTVIYAVIASFFHGTAIVGIAIFALGHCTMLVKNVKWQRTLIAIIILATTVVFTQWENILSWLIGSGIVPERYRIYAQIFAGNYSSRQAYMVQVNVGNYVEVAYRCLFAFLGFIWGYRKNMIRSSKNMAVYINIASMCALFCLLAMIILNSSYGLRAVWNNEFIYLLLLPQLMSSPKISLRQTNIRFLIIAAVIVSYFLIGYIGFGWHGVSPLQFAI